MTDRIEELVRLAPAEAQNMETWLRALIFHAGDRAIALYETEGKPPVDTGSRLRWFARAREKAVKRMLDDIMQEDRK